MEVGGASTAKIQNLFKKENSLVFEVSFPTVAWYPEFVVNCWKEREVT